jgi:homoserine kinase
MKNKIKVFAPATVANLGCGFDSMGLAIDLPGDELVIERNKHKALIIKKISGDQGKLSADPLKNTATVAIQALLEAIGSSEGFNISLHKKMPLGSGLGSSAASAVAGVFAVNELLGRPLRKDELVKFAMEGERLASGTAHADNAGPCMLGGIVLIRSYEPFEMINLPVPSKLNVIVVHPEVEVLTKNARAVLPDKFSLRQGIAQWSNTAALVAGLYTSDYELIGRSVTDFIAEPYRAGLIPGFENVKSAAIRNGALACSISGSGPSVFALTDDKNQSQKIADAMKKEFTKEKIKSRIYISKVNTKGAILLSLES